ncbi:MAG: hypothetical protein ACKO4T_00665 [Planctomycetaceae bacterium]
MDLWLRPIVSALAVGLIGAGSAVSQEAAPGGAYDLPGFDFTRPGAVAEWQPAHDVSGLEAGADGMVIGIDGGDPFIIGPPRDYPADLPVRMTLRIRPAVDGHAQVFFFRDHAGEDRSVALSVRGGMRNDVQALLPPLGPATRLRIDPPGRSGAAVVTRLGFEPAASLPAPHWPEHRPPDIGSGRRLENGSLAVEVTSRGFAMEVNGVRSAASHSQPVAGYLADGSVRWVALSAADWTVDDAAGDGATTIVAEQSIRDPDGGTWQFCRRFTAGREPGTIDVEVVVHVDVDRQVAFLPLLLLVAHEGTPRKQQGVFPGLEYLADEPSSSEADLVGPPSRRQLPMSHTITLPLMAVAHAGRVVGLAWDHEAAFAAVFDSPDRLLGSGGHLLGVVAPGSTGLNRYAGSLMPIDPMRFKAGMPLTLRATLVAAAADTVVPAIRAAVQRKGLPPVPDVGNFDSYVRLAAAGWLDSGIREHGRYRHAIGANFQPQPAADAAVFTAWLAGHAAQPVAGRLQEASAAAAAAVLRGSFDAAVIGHVRQPVQSLVFGRVEDAVAEHATAARRLMATVRPDGTVAYRPGADGVDYGRTNATDHACGLSASTVADAIEAARFAGDAGLIDEAVVALRRLARTYTGDVPRGGQTWEIPLHTPDVMASAHMVRALTIGHELTGDRDLLEQAVAWAWTGVPFIYLVDPVGTDDGPYGCVTVYGATGWTSPVWIGRPVQWCGLVYAHALYRLARHDPTGPWRHLADGITATGIRYSWPAAGTASGAADGTRQGLLPDGWDVREGIRLDPPINPGTLQACAVELFRKGPLLDCRVLPFAGGRLIVHAPGAIEPAAEPAPDRRPDGEISVSVSGWPRAPYAVLVTGLPAAPGVMIDGRDVELAAPHRFDAAAGRLVLHLDAPRLITFRQPPTPPTP